MEGERKPHPSVQLTRGGNGGEAPLSIRYSNNSENS